MKLDITVICPGIRFNNWVTLYNSIKESFSGSFELIIISPYQLPEALMGLSEVRWIKDFGTPIRCQQIGLVNSHGKYITWAADDGVYLKNSLDIAFKRIENRNNHSLIMGKYIEGSGDGDMPMSGNDYYNLKNHDASRLPYLKKECYLMLNVGLVPTELLIDVGGWDCQFEVCPMSYNDLALRLQNYDVNFIIQNEIMYTCSHLPGLSGDHGPIHNAQIYHDQPLFNNIYSSPESEKRIKIDINNWKNSPERWVRRFGKA